MPYKATANSESKPEEILYHSEHLTAYKVLCIPTRPTHLSSSRRPLCTMDSREQSSSKRFQLRSTQRLHRLQATYLPNELLLGPRTQPLHKINLTALQRPPQTSLDRFPFCLAKTTNHNLWSKNSQS